MPKKKDENELANSIIDDLIEWTESEDFEETESKKIARQGGKARALLMFKLMKFGHSSE